MSGDIIMDSQKLTIVVNQYLKMSNVSYAIMINGKWGIGKTRFIKDHIAHEENTKNIIYVSLYGVKSGEDIKDAVFTSLTSISEASKSSIKESGQIINSVINIFSESGKDSSIGTIASTLGSALKNRILAHIDKEATIIFDDLERACFSKHEVLATINQFVEHQQIRCIVLCDETKIPEEENYEYYTQKEKVILHTNTLERSPRELTDITFNNVPIIKEFLEPSKECLIKLLTVTKTSNLRTIIHATQCYSNILSELKKEKHPQKDNLRLVEYLTPCLMYSIGYREQSMALYELEEFHSKQSVISHSVRIEMKKTDINKHNKELTLEDKKWGYYYNTVTSTSHENLTLMENKSTFLTTCQGYLDYPLLDSEISKWGNEEKSAIWEISNYNSDWTNEDIQRLCKGAIDEIKESKPTEIPANVLEKSTENIHYFVETLAFDYPIEHLESDIENFYSFCINQNLINEFELYRTSEEAHQPFQQKMRKILRQNLDRLKQDHFIKNSQKKLLDLFDETNNQINSWRDIYSAEETPYITTDYIEQVNHKLLNTSALSINAFSVFIKERYPLNRVPTYYSQEKNALNILLKSLDNHIETATPSLKTSNYFLLKKRIQTIIEKHNEYISNEKNNT